MPEARPTPGTGVAPHEPAAAAGFEAVFGILREHMRELDACLRDQLTAFEPEIQAMVDYCIDTSGKRLRPALVFLSGWRDGVPDDQLVRAAAVVELVHLATLVHDDIMDGADLRRNRRTAAREFGASAAVLLGDALFAHSLTLAAKYPTPDICHDVANSTRKVCAGEIVQTLRRGTTNITRADYFRVIDLKTAELFRLSCQLGAKLARHEDAFVEAAARFGRHLGIAYQIYDDLVDFFGEEQRIGKTLGTDLASGKLTLPLLALMDRLPAEDRAALAAEISGEAAPQSLLRLRQMRETGVFGVVTAELETELAAAAASLAPWRMLPPVPLLLKLSDLLQSQVTALRARAA
ncbi:polyprenyl synthetase family protein [Horticoccus luteus]|uniref:Polyprenyl synthetase family protein n=1 Tax=Horticoccus luteus TaxID=2862869 RepID=A0A8F9XHP9_9BACT|nr:polyprenyl synthetase family protein [Horticoccus luteus]QYM79570.1 polyprenyl synthetase family protein [Horticoccus luteus]